LLLHYDVAAISVEKQTVEKQTDTEISSFHLS